MLSPEQRRALEGQVACLEEYFGRIARGRLGAHEIADPESLSEAILRGAVRAAGATGISSERLLAQLRRVVASTEQALISDTVREIESVVDCASDLSESSDEVLYFIDQLLARESSADD